MDCIPRLTLEAPARRLCVEDRPLELTNVEYEILACLVRAAGTIVARERLIAEVFAREARYDDRSLDVHISHLRKKLAPHGSLIVTIRGVGHMLRACASNERSR